jgi:hypothetical protein
MLELKLDVCLIFFLNLHTIKMLIEGAVLFELHKLCATFSESVNINYCLPIKVYYRICTLRYIRIEINHGSQNVFVPQGEQLEVNLLKVINKRINYFFVVFEL